MHIHKIHTTNDYTGAALSLSHQGGHAEIVAQLLAAGALIRHKALIIRRVMTSDGRTLRTPLFIAGSTGMQRGEGACDVMLPQCVAHCIYVAPHK